LFDELMFLVAGRFGRAEPRRTAREFVAGLLSPAERKNCWWLAERAGHGDPQAMQRLLRTAVWDADAVRDDLRGFVAAQLGDAAWCIGRPARGGGLWTEQLGRARSDGLESVLVGDFQRGASVAGGG
jgi:SRSO17 transposase